MSYDLVFWRQMESCVAPAQKIYEDLLDRKTVDGLEIFPVAEFRKRLEQQFPGITTTGGLTYWEGGDRGFFELYTSNQHVHLCCRQLKPEEMNKAIDIAVGLGCPLYDPQVPARFV
jgi:hypothetical protein